MFVATLLLTLLAGCITWWVLRRQLDPLRSATRQLALMAADVDSLEPLPVVRPDEVGLLVSGFNRLLCALKERGRALKESAAHYRLLTEDVADIVWKVDRDLRVTYVSPADERLRGYPAREVIGCHFSQCVCEPWVETLQEMDQRYKAHEASDVPAG